MESQLGVANDGDDGDETASPRKNAHSLEGKVAPGGAVGEEEGVPKAPGTNTFTRCSAAAPLSTLRHPRSTMARARHTSAGTSVVSIRREVADDDEEEDGVDSVPTGATEREGSIRTALNSRRKEESP